MRRLLTVPALVIPLLLTMTVSALAYDGSFADDDGSVHEADIEKIATEGITRGCNPPDNTRFCPDGPVSRGEMAAFLDRALGLSATQRNYFSDDNDSIFEPSINALFESGITSGCGGDRFCPGDLVTRGEMAAFLVRAMDYPADSTNYFSDDDQSIFEADIQALRQADVTRGCNPPDNTEFCPDAPVSRAEMATFLSRALELPRDGGSEDGSGSGGGSEDDGSGGGSDDGGSDDGSSHATFGEGQHLVGSDVQPGRYRTRTPSSSCYWERQSDTSGEFDAIIANEFTDHVTVVDIASSDAAFETSNCATWTDDLSAITSSPTANFGPGTYIVGTDVAAAQWRAPGGDSCYWERLSDFSGNTDGIIANSFGTTNPVVTISGSDAGFASSGCGTWTRV